MERRDFLIGSLVGVGVGAGVSTLARGAEGEAPTPAVPALPAADPPAAEPPPACAPSTPTTTPQPPDGRRFSFAQQGEDLILLNLLEALGRRGPTYLDVGAFHPTISSNTYLLYLAGARGVMVEPNPFMAKVARELRPEDKMLSVGVGVGSEREADYFVIRDRPQLNTFSREQVDRHIARDGESVLERTVTMPLVPIDEILRDEFETTPDIISLDVEGLDLRILESMDLETYRPAIFCVETLVLGTNEVVGGIYDFMRTKNYVVRGATFVNTMFIDAALLGEGRIRF